jgi:1L-myo-inositol 1-phosphate cytidylyltransferase/CDP-L-myo-inositol myo-inositolphosphotransferase
LKKQQEALILAAGYGSRMNQIGKVLPKCLLKYKNKSILDQTVDYLIRSGIKNINVAVGYKSNSIIRSLKKYQNIKLTFYKVKDYRSVGSSYSWYSFRNIWNKKKSLIVMHADNFYKYNLLKKIIDSNKKDMIGSVIKNNNTIKIDGWIIKSNQNNLIKEIKKKQNKQELCRREIACINKFSPHSMKLIFDFMKIFFLKNGKNYTWEILLNEIIKKKNIKIYTNNYSSYWFNINTKTDYNNLKKYKIN